MRMTFPRVTVSRREDESGKFGILIGEDITEPDADP